MIENEKVASESEAAARGFAGCPEIQNRAGAAAAEMRRQMG